MPENDFFFSSCSSTTGESSQKRCGSHPVRGTPDSKAHVMSQMGWKVTLGKLHGAGHLQLGLFSQWRGWALIRRQMIWRRAHELHWKNQEPNKGEGEEPRVTPSVAAAIIWDEPCRQVCGNHAQWFPTFWLLVPLRASFFSFKTGKCTHHSLNSLPHLLPQINHLHSKCVQCLGRLSSF